MQATQQIWIDAHRRGELQDYALVVLVTYAIARKLSAKTWEPLFTYYRSL